MDAPKCRLCGGRHWGMCPKSEVPVIRERVAAVVNRGMMPADDDAVRREGEKFDRVKYQREYMRRYRAKKRRGE